MLHPGKADLASRFVRQPPVRRDERLQLGVDGLQGLAERQGGHQCCCASASGTDGDATLVP